MVQDDRGMNLNGTSALTLGLAATLVATAFVASDAASSADAPASAPRVASPPGPTLPVFDPANFTRPVTNVYFPLTPGLVTRLHGRDEDESFVEKVRVTHRVKPIAGVTATVVRDVVRRSDGVVAETTDDWYANDNQGNVWYLGEDTATYDEHGNLQDREGSWEAGKAGAQPGIIMPADPRPSHADFMEYSRGVAEDQAWVVQRRTRVHTPGGRFTDVVRTFEWGRLEPNVISQKFYAAGLGIVEEQDVAGGGNEHFWVVSYHG
jgi:hypothetical protein